MILLSILFFNYRLGCTLVGILFEGSLSHTPVKFSSIFANLYKQHLLQYTIWCEQKHIEPSGALQNIIIRTRFYMCTLYVGTAQTQNITINFHPSHSVAKFWSNRSSAHPKSIPLPLYIFGTHLHTHTHTVDWL